MWVRNPETGTSEFVIEPAEIVAEGAAVPVVEQQIERAVAAGPAEHRKKGKK